MGEKENNEMEILCESCQEKVFIEMMGSCSNCDNTTNSFAFSLCENCAEKMKRCQICGELLQIKIKIVGESQPPIKIVGPTQPIISPEIVAKLLGAKIMTDEEIKEFFRKHNIPYHPGRK